MTLDVTAEVTGLLQEMIRAACVNDGTPESGHESRNAAILRDLFEAVSLPTETFEPLPGRQSLVTRIEGTDANAPTLLLMGHTDVVPADATGWQMNPFGGEIRDGWVWGRGAVDMLNITASMAIATVRLARSGWRPRGTLIYLGVADEEAGGTYGAQWLIKHAREAVTADYILTESGGIPVHAPGGTRLSAVAGEKGVGWRRLTVRGTPGHGSRPLGSDNAVVKAAEVVRRIAEFRPRAVINDAWRQFVAVMGFDAELTAALLDPKRIWDGLAHMPPGLATSAHASTHMTAAPTVIHGGTKTNVIADRVVLEVDIRKLPGQTAGDVEGFLADALGDLAGDVEVEAIQDGSASISPTNTPLWRAMERAAARFYPGAGLLPTLATGGTDLRFFRELGIPGYGFGLFSDRISLSQWEAMLHGNDERIDQETLRLSTGVWETIARDLLG